MVESGSQSLIWTTNTELSMNWTLNAIPVQSILVWMKFQFSPKLSYSKLEIFLLLNFRKDSSDIFYFIKIILQLFR